MKKLLTIILLSLFSCTPEGDELGNNKSETVNYIAPYRNPIPVEMVGTYYHHPGEINKGTVIITKETITFKTLMYNETLVIKEYKNIYNPVCWIKLILPDGKILKISNYVNALNNISVSIDDDGVLYRMGSFDKANNLNVE